MSKPTLSFIDKTLLQCRQDLISAREAREDINRYNNMSQIDKDEINGR